MPRRVARLASLGLAGAVLLDLGGLAVTLTQVVELGAAHVALGNDLDVVDRGGVNREGTLKRPRRRKPYGW